MPGLNKTPPTPEEWAKMEANARLCAPQYLARLCAEEIYMPSLEFNEEYSGINRVNDLANGLYSDFYLQKTLDMQKTIADYYAAAHRENSSYPFDEGVQHIKDKYKNPESSIFRFDLPPAQRDMYYRQEMALLTGSLLSIRDPYALASIGGVMTAEEMHDMAMKAVREKLDQMLKEGKNGSSNI